MGGGLLQRNMNNNATGIIPVEVNAQTDAKNESILTINNEHTELPDLDSDCFIAQHKDIPSQGKTRTIYYPNAHVPVKAKDEASSAPALSPTQEVMKLGDKVCDANNESEVVETSPYFMQLGFCRCAKGILN